MLSLHQALFACQPYSETVLLTFTLWSYSLGDDKAVATSGSQVVRKTRNLQCSPTRTE